MGSRRTGLDYDMMDEMKVYEEIIKENISFGDLLIAHPLEKETIEGIMQLILETVLNKNQTMLIARMDKEQQKDALAQLEAMISDEEKHEKPDYEKVQEILDKYSDVENESIFSRYIECFRNILTELILESYDVAAFVYQKRCVEGLTIEEIMKNTRLTRDQLNMFVRYFDARQNAATNKETDTGSIDQTRFH